MSGAHIEIVEKDHKPGNGVIPTRVAVNGVDVGTLGAMPAVSIGHGETQTTVTLVLVPSLLEVKGDDVERKASGSFGFSAERINHG